MKYYKENISVINLKGEGVEDFLQRISTNEIRNFGVKGTKRTIFLNEKGKIVDFVTILKRNEDFLMITTNGNEDKLKKHFEKFIVMEDISFSIEKVEKQTFIAESDIEFNVINDFDIIEGNYYCYDEYKFRKIIALIYNENSVYLKNLYVKSEELSEDAFRSFAIDNAYVYSVTELNENINPLECQLKDFISFEKGCYIGQEVIARLDSQGKIPKVMVIIAADFRISKDDKIFSIISGVETECGFISSVVSTNYNFKGLGFIREVDLRKSSNYYINKDNNKIISINKLN
ncbi:MAG: hypothetical protein WC139_14195 [Candidatus Kapaibacterium sp.]